MDFKRVSFLTRCTVQTIEHFVEEMKFIEKTALSELENSKKLYPGIVVLSEGYAVAGYIDSSVILSNKSERMTKIIPAILKLASKIHAIYLLTDSDYEIAGKKAIIIMTKYANEPQINELYERIEDGKIINKGITDENFGFDLSMLLK